MRKEEEVVEVHPEGELQISGNPVPELGASVDTFAGKVNVRWLRRRRAGSEYCSAREPSPPPGRAAGRARWSAVDSGQAGAGAPAGRPGRRPPLPAWRAAAEPRPLWRR